MCKFCWLCWGRGEKSKHRRNASVVIDRGDKEDCCCVQKKADIELQVFLPPIRRDWISPQSNLWLIIHPHRCLTKRSYVEPYALLDPNSKCLAVFPEGILYRGITMDRCFCQQNTKSILNRAHHQTSLANGGRDRHEMWVETEPSLPLWFSQCTKLNKE